MSSPILFSASTPSSSKFAQTTQSILDSGTSPKDSGTAEGSVLNGSEELKEQSAAADRYFTGESTIDGIENGHFSSPESDRQTPYNVAPKGRSGGFLLESPPLQVSKKNRHTEKRSSQWHEHRSRATDKLSMSERKIVRNSVDIDGHIDPRGDHGRHQSTSIDPSDIVRMALSLNESRRISNGQGNAAPTFGSPAGRHLPASPRIESPTAAANHLGSLREYLNKPGSRGSGGPNSSNRSRKTWNSSGSNLDSGLIHHFSPGTLTRADRARNFIQLHAEYRRALEYLPPLHNTKPKDQKQSGQNLEDDVNTELGRPYNPLQYLRNKRVRLNEQMILDPASMGWNDTYNVKSWVDSLSQRAGKPGFTDGDVVHLPRPSASQRGRESSFGPLVHQPSSDPFAQKVTRPKFDWSITPEGLLADAYWLEQDSHKTYIESRLGAKVFEHFRQPKHAQWAHSGERKLLERPASLSSNGSDGSDDYRASINMSASKTKPNDSKAWKRINSKPVGYSKHAAAKVKRHLLRRRTASSSSSATISDLERGPHVSMNRTRSSTAENIGPLERHMKQMQLAEYSKRSSLDNGNDLSLQSTATSQGSRRGAFSEEHDVGLVSSHKERKDNESPYNVAGSPVTVDADSLPRISLDNFDDSYGNSENLFEPTKPRGLKDQLKRKTRVPRLGFFRRGESKAENAIEETDFATLRRDSMYDSKVPAEESPPSTASLPSKNTSHTSLPKLATALSRSRPGSQDASSTPARKLFRSSRLGQLIRDEAPTRTNDTNYRSHTPRKQSKASLVSIESSDTEEEDPIIMANQPQRLRSLSSGDLSRSSSFHIKNLPTFRSANAPELPKDLPSPVPENKAEESTGLDTLQARNGQRRMSRFQRLRTETPDSSDVSPNTSNIDVRQPRRSHRRAATSDAVGLDRGRDLSLGVSVSRSRSRVRDEDDRLNAVLKSSGGVGKGGLPVTGLSRVEVKKEDPRAWSIAKTSRPEEPAPAIVTSKEVSFAHCHLLSTGIMAKGILLRANEVQLPPPDFLKGAGLAAGMETPMIARRLQYATAANLYSKRLEKMVTIFEESAQNFRQHTCNNLHSRIDDLRDKVTPALAPAVQNCSDSADAFIAELTTTKTMAVKQVNDAVDAMLRIRRRRLRYFKRSGFALLEWTLVALMWWIWLFVFLFRGCRSVLGNAIRLIRWLLWL